MCECLSLFVTTVNVLSGSMCKYSAVFSVEIRPLLGMLLTSHDGLMQ